MYRDRFRDPISKERVFDVIQSKGALCNISQGWSTSKPFGGCVLEAPSYGFRPPLHGGPRASSHTTFETATERARDASEKLRSLPTRPGRRPWMDAKNVSIDAEPIDGGICGETCTIESLVI